MTRLDSDQAGVGTLQSVNGVKPVEGVCIAVLHADAGDGCMYVMANSVQLRCIGHTLSRNQLHGSGLVCAEASASVGLAIVLGKDAVLPHRLGRLHFIQQCDRCLKAGLGRCESEKQP